MKLSKANQKGSPVRHVITHAPRASAPNKTFKARCSLAVSSTGKVVYSWRIYEGAKE